MRIIHAKGPGYFTSSTLENLTSTASECQTLRKQLLVRKSPQCTFSHRHRRTRRQSSPHPRSRIAGHADAPDVNSERHVTQAMRTTRPMATSIIMPKATVRNTLGRRSHFKHVRKTCSM